MNRSTRDRRTPNRDDSQEAGPVNQTKKKRSPSSRSLPVRWLRTQLPRLSMWRALGGCLIAFVCVVLIYTAIGGVAVYEGLKERAAINVQEAEVHYERGLAHVENGEYELAMAEFEHTLRLDPAHREAREALRDAKTTALAQPTPTSATLNEALNAILIEADNLIQEQKWPEAIERLTQLRDLDPNFQPEQVSDMLYTANLNLGQQLLAEGKVDESLHHFEQAAAERPDASEASRQTDMASLYVSAQATWGNNWPDTISFLDQLYKLDPQYLDVETLLYQAYVNYGDDLVEEEAWCMAEPQYMQASALKTEEKILAKQREAEGKCKQTLAEETVTPSPSPTAVLFPTPVATTIASPTLTITTTGTTSQTVTAMSGSILFSRYSDDLAQWEIVSVDPSGGEPVRVLGDATQPAISPNGNLLAYHAESASEGLHVYNLTTGEDTRFTEFGEDVTPSWGPDNWGLAFPSRRASDRKWRVYLDWADLDSESVPLTDGRTPALSPDGAQIAYQGTDPEGNQPGLYLINAKGGPSTHLTDGVSDRSPVWSPDCARAAACQIAFMSSSNGNWDIYAINVEGGTVRAITQSPGNDGLPTWSPDGQSIAFVSDRDGTWGIYVTPAAGGEAKRVADWIGSREDWMIEQITWAP